MARPPAGPMGNSPRDVRDDAVGVPAENVNAPEPPRWPPKPKKITKNTFHAKVSGGKAPKRADRAPHFRKGGWVSGYAAGGSVEKKRDELPGENKNDPFAKQNLKGGGGVKKKARGGPVSGTEGPYSPGAKSTKATTHFHAESDFDPHTAMGHTGPSLQEAQTDEVGATRRMKETFESERPFGDKRKAGGAVKRQEGGSIGADLQAARDRGTVEARKIMRGDPLRSESTERARALSRANQDLTNRAAGGRGMPREERDATLQTFKETGEYKSGGKVSK